MQFGASPLLSRRLGAIVCSGLLLANSAAAQIAFPRGDADCSAQLSAVDLVAAVRGAGGASLCGNDDCDRDGAVTPADLTCAVGCLFGTCPTPPNAPRITDVVADSAPSIVPLSVIRITVDNLGSAERLKRVTIGDAEAQIVGTPNPDALSVLVPNIEPGPADVVVHDGDLAGFPFPITVGVPVPIGVPDTFDGSLDALHQVLVGLGLLDLDGVYGEDADAVRDALAHLRSTLGIARAGLAADPTFTPEARAQLDAALESSGLPEQLRQLLADINAIQSGGAAAGAEGGGAAIDPFTLIAIASTAIAAIAGLASGGLALGAAAAIASVLVNLAATLGLNAAGVTAPPKITIAEFQSRSGDLVLRAVEGGPVIIHGERLFSTNLIMLTASGEKVLSPEASDTGALQFRIPRGVYGVCGAANFFLRQTVPPFGESNQIRRSITPELAQISPDLPVVPDDQLVLEVRGATGCNPVAHFHGSKGESFVPTEYRLPTQERVFVPALLPGAYELSLKVGTEETESLPIDIRSLVTGLKVECDQTDLLVSPGAPVSAACTARPLPLGVKVPIPFRTLRWSSSDTGTASVQEMAATEGIGHATFKAVAPGTTKATAALPLLNLASNAVSISVRDATPPSVTLSAPATADPDASIAVSVSARDNVFVTRIVLHATGDATNAEQEFPCAQLEKTCANGFTVGLKSMGTVTLVADAFDGFGNKGTSNAVTVTINPPPADTKPPVVMITAPPNGGTVNAGEAVQASVHASDNQPGDSGVQRIVIDVSGDALVGAAHDDTTFPAALPDATRMVPFTVKSAADLANVTNKSIAITAQAFDAAGNMVSQTATVSVLGTLDTCDGGIQAAPPRGYIGDPVTITVVLAGPAAARVARVTSTNPGGNFDLQPQGNATYTVTLFYQGQGFLTLSFTAFDTDGHTLCSGSIGLEALGDRG